MNDNIKYEDQHILVCRKPAGVPVQSKRAGVKDMVSILKNYLVLSGKSKGEPYLGLIHRLDQPVEGIMVFAKTQKAAAQLTAQITNHQFKKQYRAVVCGKVEPEQGTLVDYILKNGRENVSKVVKKDTRDAKEAILHYQVEKQGAEYALVSIDLVTGRHHQIRVQFANAGFPLYGDSKYNPARSQESRFLPLALCACRLEFHHPVNGKAMCFETEPEHTIFTSI